MFGAMYTISPYMGCSHGCLYCDGRSEKYHLDGDFANDITIKRNIEDLLQAELPKLREKAPIHFASGISDVYQRAEKDYKIISNCSNILKEYDFHVSVLTKSSLILRDIDNWEKVNKRGGFTLQMSLTTLDDNIRKIMEPGAPSIDERLDTIRAFKDLNCKVGIYMMPLLPGITDTEKNINELINKLIELKVDYITPGSLTLRPGRQKDIYINEISKSFPQLKTRYGHIYSENRASGMTTRKYESKFYNSVVSKLNGINILPPHSLYRNTMPLYCELNILLEHMIQLYSHKNIKVDKLNTAYNSIHQYLLNEKKTFNKKRSLTSDHIDNHLKFLLKTESFDNIIQNEKLTRFIKEVILERKIFNYQTLKIEAKNI